MDIVASVGVSSLVSMLMGELKLSKGVYKDMQEIKVELEFIQAFLKDADLDVKADVDYSVRNLVKQVTEVAYSIEDVIDEYILRIARDRHRNRFVRALSRIAHPTRKLKIRSGLASEIEKIKDSVREISERNYQSYGRRSEEEIRPVDVAQQQPDPRVSKFSLFTEEEAEVFVMEPDTDQLISQMNDGKSERIVISVVGMGGIGKTTLAKKIYDIQNKTGSFDCSAWINVSQRYKREELLRSMIYQFYKSANESLTAVEAIESMDEEMVLIETLMEYLQHKRYLVIFDDVWNMDFWTSIKHALPDINNGNRILITTRKQSVAYSFQDSSLVHIHQLCLLPEDKAWELFCKKAFQSDFGGLCPPELEDLSRRFFERCRGMPLAIAVMGGLLSAKVKSVFQWKSLYEKLKVYSDIDPHDYRGVLTTTLLLSFDDLPYNLKSCFLYLGLFPEDYSINCSRLVRLWIAEGFVKEMGGRTMEEVAYEYLAELIRRNMVYVADVKFDGKARSCRVHDLMRDIIILKSKELSFCEVLIERNSISLRARRLSIQCDIDTALTSIGNSMTRSILLFKVERLPTIAMARVCADFKLLKVLDFEDAPLDSLPKEVGGLFHLRYLSIRGTRVEKLPKSIGKLYNLETLDVKYTRMHELPTQISRLLNLRHLLASTFGGGVKMQEGIGCLEALQKLYYVNASYGIDLIKELGNLRQLRKLGIMKLTTTDCKELCFSIGNMFCLQSLHIASLSEDEIIDLQPVKNPPSLLRDIFMTGRLVKLPDWIVDLQNLVTLHLISSRLIDDPLKVLQALPQLSLLVLDHAYDGTFLYFEAGGFQRLKRLELTGLINMEEVKIDDGALPILEELNIGLSPNLKKVPSGIQYLPKLTTLRFVYMPEEFVHNMLPDGLDFHKVAHIPVVLFKQKNNTGRHHTYTLSDMPKELYR